ncbi:inhibitor of growth proteins N-terminal histone-binding-domain-containing protein [Cladorrhinum sp. PSN259]|nr:inhibitor of growth proteins N-terminal histone-binding-domain-containing protein [Cladorrhinum sp. PSN259]
MPRDDLSIDFVRKMPPVESLDPALILDEWINKTQNLPEEIRFLQDEIADKDRQYDKLVRELEDRDGRIQRWIKAHGSHQHNPKEDEYRALIRRNFAQAEQLSNEKIALTQKLQTTMDKHIRQLDAQIKMLYDRAEPGFTDPDELPSLIRPSNANMSNSNPAARPVNTLPVPAPSALNPVINNASQSAIRATNPQVRNTQAAQHHHGSASAPATPAASMLMHNRQARESSAGPPKRGNPRSHSGLGNFASTSSGLARHTSLGPGTPKGHHATTAINTQRAGSAGPARASSSKISGTGGANSRKAGTPGSTAGGTSRSGSNKKGGTPANAGSGSGSGINKSGLSRVKRAAKNSPSSNADSELSDAGSGSGEDSDVGHNTPAGASSSHHRSSSNHTVPHLSNSNSQNHHEHNSSGPNNGPGGSNSFHGPSNTHGPPPGSSHGGGHHGYRPRDDYDDAMDVDEDDAGDDKKYCSCQNVSFGNMVACDNEDCPYEWFHWGCVGLKSEPNGTWYCPDCSESMRKKGRTGS